MGATITSWPCSLEIKVLQNLLYLLEVKFFSYVTSSFGKFRGPEYRNSNGAHNSLLNTANCFLISVWKDVDKKINYILKCDVIHFGWLKCSITFQADIEGYTSSAMHSISKLLTNWDLTQVTSQHIVTTAMADTVRNSWLIHFIKISTTKRILLKRETLMNYLLSFLMFYSNQILLYLGSSKIWRNILGFSTEI